MTVYYEGTVRGFRMYGLRELRKAAMAGVDLKDPGGQQWLQRALRRARVRDLRDQIRRNLEVTDR